jgi:hypothetical protein
MTWKEWITARWNVAVGRLPIKPMADFYDKVKRNNPFSLVALLTLFLSIAPMVWATTWGLEWVNRNLHPLLEPTVGSCGTLGLGQIWESKYDCASRLWLLGSFFTTLVITSKVFYSLLIDSDYNQVRKKPLFSISAFLVLGLSIALPFTGCIGFFAPVNWGGVFFMKGLALGSACSMFVFDLLMLIAVWKECDKLKKEFTKVLIMVDLPVVCSIAFVIHLAHTYNDSLLPFFVGSSASPGSNAVFVHGLSAGAVAIEIWFANFLFFYLLNESERSKRATANAPAVSGS